MQKFLEGTFMVFMLVAVFAIIIVSGTADKILTVTLTPNNDTSQQSKFKSALPLKFDTPHPRDVVSLRPVLFSERRVLHLIDGKVSWFGGIGDKMEIGKSSAFGERMIDFKADKQLYCAFRFPMNLKRYFGPNSESFIEFRNPSTGDKVRCTIRDWGPHKQTGRAYDLSRLALHRLGLSTDDVVEAILHLQI